MSSNQQQLMSSPPSPMVWFLLVDSDTGLPYKGTSADYVCLPPGYVVAQFRDAVQLKYDKPNYLRDIPSSALLVYKNKSSFDKRNTSVEEGKESYLEEDSLINDLGLSKKEALIVVVRQTVTSAPIVSMAYGKADMKFISESTEIQENQKVWGNIPVDESITPSADFVELFKKNCSVFEFETEASRRTVIDLFLREIVSQFPAFQVICEYHMTVVNEVKKRRLNGRCDYTICHRGFRDLPHLVAIEAKITNTETLLQCIGECASIHYRRKQNGMLNLRVYGIHSTGSIWKFVYVSQEGVVHVSGENVLNVKNYVEEGFNLIYRLVHYVIQQSFVNSPRSTPNVSTVNIAIVDVKANFVREGV